MTPVLQGPPETTVPPTPMADPLGGAAGTAVGDAKDLVTGTYVPLLVGAVLFGIVLRIGFKWFRKATRAAGG